MTQLQHTEIVTLSGTVEVWLHPENSFVGYPRLQLVLLPKDDGDDEIYLTPHAARALAHGLLMLADGCEEMARAKKVVA